MAKHATLSTRLTAFGPTALVTGASDGIGRSSAEHLAKAGFDLVVCARRQTQLEELAARLTEQHGVTVRVVAADLGTEPGLNTLIDVIRTTDIGVAVLAAGFGTSGPFIANAVAEERNMLAVNCDAVIALTHVLATRMIKRGTGQITVPSSIVAFQGNVNSANYSATKAWVQTFAEGLAKELKPHNVHVLSVAPGPVNSGFAERAGMVMNGAATPDVVGRAIAKTIGRAGTIRPGFLSKLLGWSLAITPRPIRTQIMGAIMTGMTSHQVSAEPALSSQQR